MAGFVCDGESGVASESGFHPPMPSIQNVSVGSSKPQRISAKTTSKAKLVSPSCDRKYFIYCVKRVGSILH